MADTCGHLLTEAQDFLDTESGNRLVTECFVPPPGPSPVPFTPGFGGGLAIIEDWGGCHVMTVNGKVVGKAKNRDALALTAINAGCRVIYQ